MSAPYSIGRKSTGVATVLSTISGSYPRDLAELREASSMSQTFPAGLPTDSQNTARAVIDGEATITPQLRSLAA